MPKAYSYKRFSTPEQSKGDSIRRQTKAAELWASRNNIELDEELSFDDLGVSAFHGNNSSEGMLSQFLYAIESGLVEKGSYLLIENLDRLSRETPKKALRRLEDICELGITVVTLMDNREYTEESLNNDTVGLIVALLTFMRGNEESRVKSERIKSAWEEKRKNANTTPMTSNGPAWLKLDKSSNKWETIDDRVDIVQKIFKWTLEGKGQHAIANQLNKSKVPVFGRGKHWHRSYIAKILKNNAVRGFMTPRTQEYVNSKKVFTSQEPISNYYPSIVDEETWIKVQSLNTYSSSPNRGRHAGKVTNNLLGGLSKCPLCKSTMTLVDKGKKSKPKLICTKAKTGAGCKYHGVHYDIVEQNLLEYIQIMQADIPSGQKSDIDERVYNKEAEIDGIEDARGNIILAIEQGGHNDTLLNRLSQLDKQHYEAMEQLEELHIEQYETTGLIAKSKLSDLQLEASSNDNMDRTKLNTILRQVFKRVIINYTTGNLEFEWQQGGWSAVMYAWLTPVD